MNNDLNEEVAQYLSTLKTSYCYNFRTYRPDLYAFIFESTKFMDKCNPTFRGRLTAVVNRLQALPRCQLEGCGKELDIHDWRPKDSLPKHCCCKHAGLDKKTQQLRAETCMKTYGKASVLQLDSTRKIRNDYQKAHQAELNKKSKATRLAKYGNENYVNLEKMRQTKLEKYGDANYNNVEKIKQTHANKSDDAKKEEIEKRRTTYFQHKAEDPEFAAKIQEKSVATRKKNHGDDYTGRAKCKKTLLKNYGCENSFQLERSKEKSKETMKSHYGVEHALQHPEIAKKAVETCRQTCLEKYGTTSYSSSQQCKDDNKERYGVEHLFQAEEFKEKSRKTCLEKYGHENAMQCRDVRVKGQQKYHYDGLHFDSAPELAFYIWLADHSLKFEYQPNISFEYECNGKKHVCMPDFEVDGQLFELKGDQFLKEDGTWQNPYDHQQDARYEAKHQCLLKNNVTILHEDDYKKYVNSVEEKYGKEYLSNFKKIKSSK